MLGVHTNQRVIKVFGSQNWQPFETCWEMQMQNQKNLIVLWGNTCLQTCNMQSMSIFFLVDKKTMIDMVVLGDLVWKRKKKFVQLLLFFGFWNKVVLSLTLRPWVIVTLQKNIGWKISQVMHRIVLIKIFKTIHVIEFLVISCTRWWQLTINLGVTFMLTLLMVSNTS